MRLLSKVALGGGVVSAATATWLVAAGVLATSATLVVLDPAAPEAEAQEKPLVAFDSCDDLLDWYVENAVKDVGPYGWDNLIWPAYATSGVRDMAMASPAAGQSAGDARTSSATGTNTQEEAVDEPDIAKTNGTLIARILNDNQLVLIDVSGTKPEVTARLDLPRRGYQSELLLVGTRVLITQQVYETSKNDGARIQMYVPGRAITRLLDVDISDPSDPRIASQDRYTGQLLSARQYGDTIRLVTSSGRPQLEWTFPSKKTSRREATRLNRELVRGTSIADWLPAVSRNGSTERLLDCAEVLHPERYAGEETVVVTTFPAAQVSERTSVAITAASGVIYSSADRLYLATTDYSGVRGGLVFDQPLRSDQAVPVTEISTALHAFVLTPEGTAYLGSGEVDGMLRDRWSLDEHADNLRVAWTRTNERGRTRNGVSIMAERDGALIEVGSVGDLGINEDLQSVRWFDDLAVLVTFRRIDPLYTVDLTNPTDPKVLGELKIPGFSGYLHPIGDDLILGLGMSGNAEGLTGGGQAAVFDISDLSDPVRVAAASFRRDTYFAALDDPRAFTWLPDLRTAVTPLSDWSRGPSKMLALEVDSDGSMTTRALSTLKNDWQSRALGLPEGRVAILDGPRVLLVAG